MNSLQYEAAIAENDKATATYNAAVRWYRLMKIGDAEYLAARAAYDAAMLAFDGAYAAEVAA